MAGWKSKYAKSCDCNAVVFELEQGRCAVVVEAADGRSFSKDMGSGCSESGPAAATVASASISADAHAHHESASCGGAERGSPAQEGAVEPAGRSELESLELASWALRRRRDLLDLFDQLTPKIHDLTRALEGGGE